VLAAVLAAVVVLPVQVASAAGQRGDYVTIKGAAGPGPARYDRAYVEKWGPKRARRVLVLVPGFLGGSGDFSEIAQDIVRRVPDLQVWAIDRRSQAFEDTSIFATEKADDAFAYYLNFRPIGGRSFKPVDAKDVPFVKQWGLKLALEDIRRVVLKARAGGRTVILGGHSLGASLTGAYASWDFDGRPGYRDVAGLVLIDGGLGASGDGPTAEEVGRRLAAVETAPFSDLLGLGIPWAAGVFAEVGALYARTAPDARSPVQDFALLPAAFKPAFPATNEGLFGYVFDKDTSPPNLSLIRIRGGSLAPVGDPRPWQDGDITPVQRLARIFAREPGNGAEWYFPARLGVDVAAASPLKRTAVTDSLGLRPWRLAKVDRPLYAFQTDLSEGRVLQGARAFIARSKVPRRRSVLVDRSSSTSHFDPLVAAPARNDFLKTVVPFLRRVR